MNEDEFKFSDRWIEYVEGWWAKYHEVEAAACNQRLNWVPQSKMSFVEPEFKREGGGGMNGREELAALVIANLEDLNALPERSIVLDFHDDVWRHDIHPSSGHWWDKLDIEENITDRAVAVRLPATVLWVDG